MRRLLLTVAVGAWAAGAQAGIVNDFSDILFWAGSGTNQAGFVLDFGTAAPPGSPPAVAWGYRWDGTASLAKMMFSLAGTITGSGAPAAVAGSDPRLGIDVTRYPNFNGPGLDEFAVNSLSYDQVGLPAGWSQEIRSLLNDYDNDRGVAQYGDPGSDGIWPPGGQLGISYFGPAGTSLASGGWYGYVVTTYTYVYDPVYDYSYPEYPVANAFSQPTAALPEPRALALAAGGLGWAAVGWRRRGWRRGRIGGRAVPPRTIRTLP